MFLQKILNFYGFFKNFSKTAYIHFFVKFQQNGQGFRRKAQRVEAWSPASAPGRGTAESGKKYLYVRGRLPENALDIRKETQFARNNESRQITLSVRNHKIFQNKMEKHLHLLLLYGII
ncbi:MAG: hypothetical protein IJW17_13975 [Lentisphaeria bacterium]|nr:hypothetical protein [Lentisphaeria bacterium]